LVSLGIMVTFLFLGETILKFLGIDVRSFAVAGALVLFFIALEMILGVKPLQGGPSAPGLTDRRRTTTRCTASCRWPFR
jgi:small neutral amino acid transporter SnatA (MarC family)